jgi:hypothetical protein
MKGKNIFMLLTIHINCSFKAIYRNKYLQFVDTLAKELYRQKASLKCAKIQFYYRLYIDLLHITTSHSVYVVYWTNVKACGKIVHTNFYCWASVNTIFSSFHLLYSLCVCFLFVEARWHEKTNILELIELELE